MQTAKRLPVVFSVSILGLTFTNTVYGGPPFVTDDPEPVEYQHWEFYVASEHAKTDGDWAGTAPHIELNYGVVPGVQLHLIAPLGYDVPPDSPTHYGYSDTELGVKIRFWDATNYLPQVGIFPLVEVPTGEAAATISATAIGRRFSPCGCKKAGAHGRLMAAAVTALIH